MLYASARSVRTALSRASATRSARARETSELNSPGPVNSLRPLVPTIPEGRVNAAGFNKNRPPRPAVDMSACEAFTRSARSLMIRSPKPVVWIAYTENGRPERAAARPEMVQLRSERLSQRDAGRKDGDQAAYATKFRRWSKSES